MSRKKKMMLNTATALIYQLLTVICGFILPKFLVPYFGSSVNGLINSIGQFLSIITLCECGVGAVVQSALYKPLAEHDDCEISKIIRSSKKFFGTIMKILAVYIIALFFIYPFLIRSSYDFGYLYIGSLILILAFKYVAQYYLFISYRLLLNADQLSYIQLSAHIIALILNTAISILLIKLNASVQIVLLASAFVFFLQPIAIKIYVDKHYRINHKIKLLEEPLKQKWNGLAQHISSVVLGSTDTIVLTVFSTLENVSIYSVYYLVTHGIRQLIVTANTGVQALLGNMYAKNEKESLNNVYERTELIFHYLVILLFTVTGIMLIPFVKVYTKNFTDAVYVVPLFSILMTLAQASYCIRIPYEMMIKVAGHYKQTQLSSFIEAGLNIVISIILVFRFGLIGVAIGTLIAMIYRTIFLAIYLSHEIIKRPIKHFIKHIIVDMLCVGCMITATSWIKFNGYSYNDFIVMTCEVVFICLAVSLSIHYIFYREVLVASLRQLLHRNPKT